jgi:two-component system cell cycle response regulator
MFDIDDFKKINDCFGHKTGDRILKDLTSLIKYLLRSTDKLFRWGGDEFIILLPESTLKNAVKVADKIREAVQLFDFGIKNRKVTISVGIGAYALNENLEQFVARVDHALLKAKFNGKNKVEIN